MRPWKTSWVLGTLFSVVFALAVATLALALRFGVESGFQTYLDASQAAAHGRIMGALEALPPVDGGWDTARVATLGRQALDQGLVLSLQDGEGHPVWSARTDDPQAVAEVFQTLERRLQARAPWEKGRWEAWDHPVATPGLGGSMTLEVFQPRRLGPSDLRFLEGLDGLLEAVALAGVVLSLLLGSLTARGLVRPLRNLKATTLRLGTGDYQPPAASGTPFREVRELEADLALLAARLAHLQGLRDTAGADTAHELRTPLANLEAQLEALEDGVLAPSPDRFAALGREVRRLGDLVQTWEELERARTPGRPLGVSEHPRGVVQATLETFGARTAARGQTIEGTLDEVPALALGDDALGRIVVNLVENAHRYTPDGGRIAVGLHAEGPAVVLTVDDDGPGIPPAHRDAVFDRFYRIDPSRSRESGGQGLGLSLVKALVSAGGGEVSAETSPWGGCRIRAVLPRLS